MIFSSLRLHFRKVGSAPLSRISLSSTAVWLSLLLVSLSFTAAAQAQSDQEVLLHEASGTSVKIRHVFSEVPSAGGTALQVTLINRLNEPLEVSLSATASNSSYGNGGHSMESGVLTLKAAAAGTVPREWIVPLMTGARRSYDFRQELRIDVNSRLRNTSSVQFYGESLRDTPFAAFSTALAGRGAIDLLQQEMIKRRTAAAASSSSGHSGYRTNGKFAALYDPAQLPSDWRGCGGLDVLAITADEWLRLPESVPVAIRQYVIMGGRLDLYHAGELPPGILNALGLKPELIANAAPRPMTMTAGAGTVRLLAWNGKELEAADVSPYEGTDITLRAKELDESMTAPRPRLQPGEKPRLSLYDRLGSRSFAAWQVGVILLMFGIVVGPVNLFYLAGQGRRHRLFYTTPLISLGAAVLLVAVIFLQDGSGGEGRRAALVHLPAGENTAYIKQYQVSRTGVLFGSGFKVPPTARLSPLVLPESRWTRLKANENSRNAAQHFTAAGTGESSGDWFQSRSEQGQLLEAVQPFRGRLEKRAAPGAGGAPVLVSGLGFRLETLYYRDAAGIWWTAPEPVLSGAEITLQAPAAGAVNDWLADQLANFPQPDRDRLQAALMPGTFCAAAADPAAGIIPTLPSIRWAEDRVILHGLVAEIP